VHVPGGAATCFEVAGSKKHAVVAATGHLPAGGIEGTHLGDDVAPQRGVAAAHHVQRGLQALLELEQRLPGGVVDLGRGRLGEAP